MIWNRTDTAVVFIDPQNDVLSPTGKNWAVTGDSVTENGTVEHMLDIFEAARAASFGMFISPHYFYPTDHGWHFNGALEAAELRSGTFDRPGPLNLDGLTGSGADWLEEFKPYIEHPETVVVSPHKVFGSQTNDLVLQLRKRGISKVLLGGCSRTCASNRICVICSSRASRSTSSAMPSPGHGTPNGATATRPRWSTMRISPTAWSRPTTS